MDLIPHGNQKDRAGKHSPDEVNAAMFSLEVSPDADLILEYCPGEHITKKLLTNDLTVLAEIAAE